MYRKIKDKFSFVTSIAGYVVLDQVINEKQSQFGSRVMKGMKWSWRKVHMLQDLEAKKCRKCQ